jgi:chromate transporter
MIGLFTIGGGYAMIPLVRELVLKYNWMSETEFYNFLGVCESTPGPIAINMATYVGSTQGGLLGSILSTLGVVLPSFIIIILVASILKKVIKNKYFQAFLNGVKPVVIALIFGTGLMLVIKCIGFININEFSFDFISFI